MLIKLKYGNTNTFLIKGESGNLLVDTDYAGTLPLFYKSIKGNDINVKDITHVLATHYHPDHMGLVSELSKQGVKLLVMEPQLKSVHYSDEIYARDKRLDYSPIDESGATVIKCEESRAFLQGLGIQGEILSTPSHSEDSVSIILDDGNCMVGDLEPMSFMDAYEDNEALKKDWELVMSYKPKVIWHAHANEKVVG